MSYSVQFNDQTQHFEHHGILGQKWGKMHGPPYPLDPRYSTGSTLRERYRTKKKVERQEKQMAKLRKKRAKIKAQEDKIAENERKKRLQESENELQYAKDAKKRQREERRMARQQRNAIKQQLQNDKMRARALQDEANAKIAQALVQPLSGVVNGSFNTLTAAINQYQYASQKEQKAMDLEIAKLKKDQSLKEKGFDLDIEKQKGKNNAESYKAQGELAITKAKNEIDKQNNQFNIDKEKRTWAKGNDSKNSTSNSAANSVASVMSTPVTKANTQKGKSSCDTILALPAISSEPFMSKANSYTSSAGKDILDKYGRYLP